MCAITSKRYVHIYSITGTVRMLFSLEGDVICASGSDDMLFIVHTHARAPPKDQSFQYIIMDVDQKCVCVMRLFLQKNIFFCVH